MENNIMNNDNLVLMQNDKALTTSKIVAKKFEKRHDHVIRDIQRFMEDVPNFGEMFYKDETTDSYGRKQKIFDMNRDGFSLLAMGFTGKKALQFKIKFINAFNEMENKLKELSIAPQPRDSYMIDDPAERAERWAMEYREKEKLALENKQKEEKLAKQKPMIDYTTKVITNRSDRNDFKLITNKLANAGYKMGKNQVMAWLRMQHYLLANGQEWNYPSQEMKK